MTQHEKLRQAENLLVDFWNIYMETVKGAGKQVQKRKGLYISEAAYCVHNLQGRMSLLKEHVENDFYKECIYYREGGGCNTQRNIAGAFPYCKYVLGEHNTCERFTKKELDKTE